MKKELMSVKLLFITVVFLVGNYKLNKCIKLGDLPFVAK